MSVKQEDTKITYGVFKKRFTSGKKLATVGYDKIADIWETKSPTWTDVDEETKINWYSKLLEQLHTAIEGEYNTEEVERLKEYNIHVKEKEEEPEEDEVTIHSESERSVDSPPHSSEDDSFICPDDEDDDYFESTEESSTEVDIKDIIVHHPEIRVTLNVKMITVFGLLATNFITNAALIFLLMK